jgi:hypothetical protein
LLLRALNDFCLLDQAATSVEMIMPFRGIHGQLAPAIVLLQNGFFPVSRQGENR